MIETPTKNKLLPNAAGMRAAAEIVDTIRKTTKGPTAGGLVFGTVVSTSPISINVDNRLTVGAGNIILSPFCIETKINLKHTHKVEVSSAEAGETEPAFEEDEKVKTTDDKEIALKHTHKMKTASPSITIENAFEEPIKLWSGLSTGDSVIMMVSADSQVYYVLQKAGGLG